MESALSGTQSLEEFKNSTALAAPYGVTPNFDNPPNSNTLAIVQTAVSIAFSTILVLIRGYTRIFHLKKSEIEDCPFYIASASMFIIIAQNVGVLVNQWNLRVRNLEEFIYLYVMITTMYCVTLMLTKTAIILEWTRLFIPGLARPPFYYICYGLIWSNCCLYVATIISTNFACTPRERIWSRYIRGTCIDTDTLNLFNTVFHLVFDLTMLLLPHRIIWKLSLSNSQKIGVSTVFSVGVVTCVCAAGRVVSAVMMRTSPDLTYAYSRHLLWGLAEVTTTVFIFCVTAIPATFRHPGPIHMFNQYLRSKISMILFPQRISSVTSLHHSRDRITHREGPIDECPWMDENSEVHLTELEPVKTRNSPTKDKPQENQAHYNGGILRTTEVDISTSVNTNVAGRDLKQGLNRYTWLDC
ncbi:hypothetical protein F4779DRAFT_626448 [Xylariaceae sp. FL0662B]|nr:hypothetical protein F4779DRAFT_626448 [Xylariaceae sp. FL0662B]